MEYILAIDQGTTGTTTLIVDKNLKRIASKTIDFTQHYPKPGWVEHDLNEIWQSVITSIKHTTENIKASQIVAIGITNQRETLCFWNKKTLEPITNAIVWQDRRSVDVCAELNAKNLEGFIQDQTGLLVDPYFSGTKASWAFNNWAKIKESYKKGELCIGTIDTFLVSKLTSGASFVTEPSNASRTMCFNLTKHKWDIELCKMLEVPFDMWPEVRPSVGNFGVTKGLGVLPDGIPISGVLGDQQAALLGQACISKGQAKCTYGTGAFILMNTGNTPAKSNHRLVTTIAWSMGMDEKDYTYALEGSAFIAGAAVQWLRDGLNIINASNEIEALARSAKSSDGVVFVPALTGLGAPYWDAEARGVISGISRGTKRAHIARATLEGVALQIYDILIAMEKDLGAPLTKINVDGGAAANNLLMEIQAGLLGVPLYRPKELETTSMGAIFAAGLGVGVWSDLKDIEKSWQKDCVFEPNMEKTLKIELVTNWQAAVNRTRFG